MEEPVVRSGARGRREKRETRRDAVVGDDAILGQVTCKRGAAGFWRERAAGRGGFRRYGGLGLRRRAASQRAPRAPRPRNLRAAEAQAGRALRRELAGLARISEERDRVFRAGGDEQIDALQRLERLLGEVRQAQGANARRRGAGAWRTYR